MLNMQAINRVLNIISRQHSDIKGLGQSSTAFSLCYKPNGHVCGASTQLLHMQENIPSNGFVITIGCYYCLFQTSAPPLSLCFLSPSPETAGNRYTKVVATVCCNSVCANYFFRIILKLTLNVARYIRYENGVLLQVANALTS